MHPVLFHIFGKEIYSYGILAASGLVAGEGLAIHSLWHVADDLRTGRLQVVLPDFPLATTAISAVMPQRRQVPPRVRAFVDFLVEEFGDNPPWERGLQA